MRTADTLLLAALLAGCASNVYVAYPDTVADGETGLIVVKLSEPMRAVTVERAYG